MRVDHRPIVDEATMQRGRALLEVRTATAQWRIAAEVLRHARAMYEAFPSRLTETAESTALAAEIKAWNAMATVTIDAGICLWPDCEVETPRTTVCEHHADLVARSEDFGVRA